MCQFLSGIVTRNDFLFDFDHDSHEKLIEKAGLDDSSDTPDFVRIEYRPLDQNPFNLSPENWKLYVDQDFLPGWFNEEYAEYCAKEALMRIVERRFIYNNQKQIKRENQRLFVAKGRVTITNGRVMADNSEIESYHSYILARNSSRILAYEGSYVQAYNSDVSVYGNSKAEVFDSTVKAWGESWVDANYSSVSAKEYSNIRILNDSGIEASDNANVFVPYGRKVHIKKLSGNAIIRDCSHGWDSLVIITAQPKAVMGIINNDSKKED